VSTRREFITLLGGAAAAWPVGVWAQEPGRTYRIGGLHQSPRNVAHHNAFYAELERQGFIIGKNLAVDSDGYGLTVERFADHAQQLVNTSLLHVILAALIATIEHVDLTPRQERADLHRLAEREQFGACQKPGLRLTFDSHLFNLD
jgi:hypothetical protein